MTALRPGKEYRISYTSSQGIATLRTILVIKTWSAEGQQYIRAWCALRNGERTFRRDRIYSAELVTSGASISSLSVSPVYVPAALVPEPPMRVVSPGGALPAVPQAAPLYTPSAPSYPPAPPRRSGALGGFLMVCLAVSVYFGVVYFSKTPVSRAPKAAAPVPQKILTAFEKERWKSHNQSLAAEFRIQTGISSPELEDYYARADLDFNRILSWQEIGSFQRRIDLSFTYQKNDTALPPDRFFAQNGGDCEDWSLFTCGLMTYWGYTCYVGIVDGSGGGSQSHAVALFYKKTKPANWQYSYFYFEEPRVMNRVALPAGYYLPIDYNYTGTFSTATKPGTPLRNVYSPTDLYNRKM